MAARLPRSIKVGPYTYSISAMSAEEIERYCANGLCHTDELWIKINVDLPPSAQAVTLAHEIMHAVYNAADVHEGDDEERVVSTISTVLCGAMRDSPRVFEWINRNLKAV